MSIEIPDRSRMDDQESGAVIPLPRTESDTDPAATPAMDTACEVELDEPAPPAPPVPVDTRTIPPVAATPGTRRPIIPPHLRPANVKTTARRAGGRAAHVAGFHTVRSPWYGLKFGYFAVRGLLRVLGRQLMWWWVPGSYEMLQHAARSHELMEWDRVQRQIRAMRLWRGTVLGLQALVLGIGIPVLLGTVPRGWLWLAASGIVVLLARYGRPAGQTLIGTAVVAPRFRKLNSDIVLRAYYAAGLGHPDKPGMQVQFGSPMSRDARNTGSQVLIDLPYGKGWSDVNGAREKIASGLDVHVNQVFLTPDKTSARRHTLFVTDRDPLAITAGRTDLLDGKPRSIWRPVRLGKDERGELVELTLMWVSVLVGAQPRKGKTFTARLIALHAALDPYVRIIVVDGKNSPDWIRFRLVAHRIVFGTHPNPNDDDPITHLIAVLNEVLAHIDRVNQILATLPVDVCPEGKLTEELARDPRYPDLRVLLLVMEEFQLYFETDDQAVNKDIAGKLARIQAVGPSAGVCLLSCSQKPSGVGAGDVGRLFNRFRDNHIVRFALRCANRNVSEAVMGGDAYAEGFDASSLPIGDEYRGVGMLYGASDNTPTTRTFLADHTDAEKILHAARAHRQRLGTLTGAAAGEQVQRQVRDVLADVLEIFGVSNRLPWQVIAARLAETMPEHYADLSADAISAQLRALAVPSENVKWDGAVLKGAKADTIRAAMTRRDSNTP